MTRTLSATQIAATDCPLDSARTLPGWLYYDAQFYATENDRLFAGGWQCVGHRSRLARHGDFFVVQIGVDSIVLSCDANGEIHAFHNVCRHRGSRLVGTQAGRRKLFTCPYHSWSYTSDGALAQAPGFDGPCDNLGLVPVPLSEFYGFLFINLDAQAPALATWLDDFPTLSQFDLGALQRVARHEYTVAANWKLICENFNECYHCANAHPQLHRISEQGNLDGFDHRGRNFTGGPMTLKAPYNTLTSNGTTMRERLPGWASDDANYVYYFSIYPNLLLTIAPDYALAHYLTPLDAESCHVETEWFFSADQIAQPGFDASDAIEFWDTTNRQDWTLCENAQRGLRSRGHLPGPYHRDEHCVHDFDRWLVRQMGERDA